MFGLVTQLWNQNPIIFLMVVALVAFGVYAAMAPAGDEDVDGAYTAEEA
jgi:hypothetical protein